MSSPFRFVDPDGLDAIDPYGGSVSDDLSGVTYSGASSTTTWTPGGDAVGGNESVQFQGDVLTYALYLSSTNPVALSPQDLWALAAASEASLGASSQEQLQVAFHAVQNFAVSSYVNATSAAVAGLAGPEGLLVLPSVQSLMYQIAEPAFAPAAPTGDNLHDYELRESYNAATGAATTAMLAISIVAPAVIETGLVRGAAVVGGGGGGGGVPAARPFALGLTDEGLDAFAAARNADTWESLPDPANWRAGVLGKLADPATQVHFNLEGVDAWGGVSRAASGLGGPTDWELLQIYQNPQWWESVQFWKGGQPVANPFQ
jgi:hypothetical protein